MNPRLPDEDFAEAVRIAQKVFDEERPGVVVGSSRGGAVAMNINSGNARLVLMCPAWKTWGTATTAKANTVILHSKADDVIPYSDSQELVRNSGLPESALIEVGTDHRLADPQPLETMLQACEERVVGSDFGVPASAGQQAKKIILIEAVRTGERSYAIGNSGRNERLVSDFGNAVDWKDRRRGGPFLRSPSRWHWTRPCGSPHSIFPSPFLFPCCKIPASRSWRARSHS